jgi:hypothetical protein
MPATEDPDPNQHESHYSETREGPLSDPTFGVISHECIEPNSGENGQGKGQGHRREGQNYIAHDWTVAEKGCDAWLERKRHHHDGNDHHPLDFGASPTGTHRDHG